MYHYHKNHISKGLLALFFMSSFLLVACDSQKPKSPALKVPEQSFEQNMVLEGVVTDENGPVLEGKIKVADSSGRTVATTELKNDKHYKVEVPAGTKLPIVLSIRPKGASEPLIAVGVSKMVSVYDISPYTTKIAKRAKELGGYTYSNMVLAADSTVNAPDANKTSTGFRGDPTKQYGGWH
ncbi:hypothetical protein [Methylomarinum vadi]|uniref:hypothetical protein n=1 Tax=Methylomarinum vadi TaxID=438855 RepID=UPI00068A9104|nr:hypothetical protein [Methylomarinum vadi]